MDGWVGGAPSKQELAVLTLLVQGWTNEEIGVRLGVTEETVKKHVTGLLRKSESVNRAELAAKAVAAGLILRPNDVGRATELRRSKAPSLPRRPIDRRSP